MSSPKPTDASLSTLPPLSDLERAALEDLIRDGGQARAMIGTTRYETLGPKRLTIDGRLAAQLLRKGYIDTDRTASHSFLHARFAADGSDANANASSLTRLRDRSRPKVDTGWIG